MKYEEVETMAMARARVSILWLGFVIAFFDSLGLPIGWLQKRQNTLIDELTEWCEQLGVIMPAL